MEFRYNFASSSFQIVTIEYLQRIGFALPIILITPTIISIWIFGVSNIFYDFFPNEDYSTINKSFGGLYGLFGLWVCWFLSHIWIISHIWHPTENHNELAASDTKLFVHPFYNSLLINHSMSLNRIRHYVLNNDIQQKGYGGATRLFAVATMWHETSDEMLDFLKSIFRLDRDQSTRRFACDLNQVQVSAKHVFFSKIMNCKVKLSYSRLSIRIYTISRRTSFLTMRLKRNQRMECLPGSLTNSLINLLN